MKDEKKLTDLYDDSGLDERIRNTADLLAEFVKENFDEKTADEIIGDLADIIDKD